jgi:uncharacterized membrane protein YccC
VPDWLPALVNAGRAFVVIGAAELFWIVTEWPNGALAITFAAIVVILLALRADQAYAAAKGFMIGTSLTAAFAAVIAARPAAGCPVRAECRRSGCRRSANRGRPVSC